MADLTRASKELFRREPDERFENLRELHTHCIERRNVSQDRWHQPSEIRTEHDGGLTLIAGDDGFALNDWSFSQLCRLASVAKDTVNRLSSETATQVFRETLPNKGTKPLQLFIENQTVRSIHGTQYTRLWNADLVHTIREFATDFTPPQKGFNGATGLYAGEQDLFCFLIDPTGWVEIDGDNFAPGFFLWNSEVGRRSVGIETFWFQRVCANHIVWDVKEVTTFTRKHTAKVVEALGEVRQIIESLVQKRDARKDGFARVVEKSMREKLGDTAEEALKVLHKQGISRKLAKEALADAEQRGGFTIFSVIDSLTRMSRDLKNAGDRTDADQKAGKLLELVEV